MNVLCSQVANKKPSPSSDKLFKWKRLTGELLFVFSSKSLDPLKFDESKEACTCAWADDKGLIDEDE